MVSSEQRKQLIEVARETRVNAYAKYSGYNVGAAILTRTGKIYAGCNVENISYGLTVCAERSAVYNAVSMGDIDFVLLAIATHDGATPCGACRQVLSEFCENLLILTIAEEDKRKVRESHLQQLLPDRFHLHKK